MNAASRRPALYGINTYLLHFLYVCWSRILAAITKVILEGRLLRCGNPRLAEAIGSDVKGTLSAVLYLAAIPLGFVHQLIADGIYVCVALMWLIPDSRIESKV